MRIGLTGGIASGKSSVADILKECGASLIDADEVYRKLIEPGSALHSRIVERWGPEILHADGSLDRKKLGRIVFASENERQELNNCTHPAIIAALRKEMAEEKRNPVVVVAPLLLEAGEEALVDELWVVVLDEETQIERLMKREFITREDALRRVRSQMPLAEKMRRADRIIDNNGPLEKTREAVQKLWTELKERIDHGTR
jgi:dephospho-CoA kinase